MKSLLLTFSTLFIVVIADAQIPAGTKLIGGSFGFGTSKYNFGGGVNRSTNFNINPTFGKAVKDNVVTGFSAYYSLNQSNSPTQKSVEQSIGIGVYKQKYLPIGSSFMAFGQGDIGGNYGWKKNDYRTYGLSAGLGAGIAYQANNRLLLTLSVPSAVRAYVNYLHDGISGTSSTRTSFGTGINTQVSLQNFQFGVLFMRK